MNEKDSFENYPWIIRKGNTVAFDTDLMPAEMEGETLKYISEANGVPMFKGEVKNAYPLTAVKNPEVCPLCGGHTELNTAEFIYSTSIGTRAMWVPGGWFCGACPTVIINQRIIADGMTTKAKFLRVVGVVNSETGSPMYFSTWCGQSTLFILDEDEQILEMRTRTESGENTFGSYVAYKRKAERKQKKSKRKQAGKARKQNRSRKKK
ncbi:MAG: hypothetical protein WD708_07905 [Kiritimatiellia bacterium]